MTVSLQKSRLEEYLHYYASTSTILSQTQAIDPTILATFNDISLKAPARLTAAAKIIQKTQSDNFALRTQPIAIES